MSDRFDIVWRRQHLTIIRDFEWSLDETVVRTLGWHIIEPFAGGADATIAMIVDGTLRAAAIHRLDDLEPATPGVEPTDGPRPGSHPHVIGCGLACDPRHIDSLGSLIWNSRVLVPQQLGMSSHAAVHFAGWPHDMPGGTEHYLHMVAYGTTRDPFLTPYLDAGFWVAGCNAEDKIAYMSR